MDSLERCSQLAAPAEQVWRLAVSEPGIRAELRPLLRMTVPPALRGRTIEEIEPGAELGRSWILLAGILPVEYDQLCIAEIGPGRRFLERSRTLALRTWTHERTVAPTAGGSRLCDRLGFELRPMLAAIPGAGRIVRALVGALFSHRHRRLRALHGVGGG